MAGKVPVNKRKAAAPKRVVVRRVAKSRTPSLRARTARRASTVAAPAPVVEELVASMREPVSASLEVREPEASLSELLAELEAEKRAAEQSERITVVSGRNESPMRAVAAFFGFALAVIAVGGFIIRTVDAATYLAPNASAPGGNVPSIIWNRLSSLATQAGAVIDIDGGVNAQGMNTFGAATLAMTGTQNLVYGNASSTSTPGTALMLLQTSTAGVGTDRLRVDTSGNVTASGKMKSAGCFGKVFVGRTTASYTPNVGGYVSADALCNAMGGAFAGSHVCRVDELLESIACSTATDPVRQQGVAYAWVNGGPPGYTAASNDCTGWTSTSGSSYGRFWSFDNTTGGEGYITRCDLATGYQFACCR